MLDVKSVAAAFPTMERFPMGGGWLLSDTGGRFWLQERRTAACVWLTPVIVEGDTMQPVGSAQRFTVGAFIDGETACEAVYLTAGHPAERCLSGGYVKATGLWTVSPMAVAS